jgi:hypothetical protein
MFARLIQLCSAFLLAFALLASSPALAGNDGIITVRSAFPIGETIERLKKDIADKGIKFFNEIDQSKLAADAGIMLRPSVSLIFSARNLLLQTPMPGSTGRCGFSSMRTKKVRCGPPIPILTGSQGGAGSRIARTSSKWHRA